MNAEKLKRLQAQVRIGGKGTPRRKKKVMHQTATTDDKKLQSSLKKLSVSTIPGIEEVNIIKDDLTVIHFNNPKAQASLSANTFAVTGHGETKKIVEMLPEILPQLGQETVVQLRMYANSMSNNQKQSNVAGNTIVAMQNALGSVVEEDDVPMLVSDFDEVAKTEAVAVQSKAQVEEKKAEANDEVVQLQEIINENEANVLNDKHDLKNEPNLNVTTKTVTKSNAEQKVNEKVDNKAKDDKKQKKQKDKPEAKPAEKQKKDAKEAKKPSQPRVKVDDKKQEANITEEIIKPEGNAVEIKKEVEENKECAPKLDTSSEKSSGGATKSKAEKPTKKVNDNKQSPAKQEKAVAKDTKAAASKTVTEKHIKKSDAEKLEGGKETVKKSGSQQKPKAVAAEIENNIALPSKEVPAAVKKDETSPATMPDIKKPIEIEQTEVVITQKVAEQNCENITETSPVPKPAEKLHQTEVKKEIAAPESPTNIALAESKPESLETAKTENTAAPQAEKPAAQPLPPTATEIKKEIMVENQAINEAKENTNAEVNNAPIGDKLESKSNVQVEPMVESKAPTQAPAAVSSELALSDSKVANVASEVQEMKVKDVVSEIKEIKLDEAASEMKEVKIKEAVQEENKNKSEEVPLVVKEVKLEEVAAESKIVEKVQKEIKADTQTATNVVVTEQIPRDENTSLAVAESIKKEAETLNENKPLDKPLEESRNEVRLEATNTELINTPDSTQSQPIDVTQQGVSTDIKDTTEPEKPPLQAEAFQQAQPQVANTVLQADVIQKQKVEIKSEGQTPTAAATKQKVSPPKQMGNSKKATTPEAGRQQQQPKPTNTNEATSKPADAKKAKQTQPSKSQQSQAQVTKSASGAAKPQQAAAAKSVPTTPIKTSDKPALAPKPAVSATTKTTTPAEGAKKTNSPQKQANEAAAKSKQTGTKTRSAGPTAGNATKPAPKPTVAASKTAESAEKKPEVQPVTATPTETAVTPATSQQPAALN